MLLKSVIILSAVALVVWESVSCRNVSRGAFGDAGDESENRVILSRAEDLYDELDTNEQGRCATDEKSNQSSIDRKAISNSIFLWPKGEVIYTYDKSITGNTMKVIEAAMDHWRQNTCITFRQRKLDDEYFAIFRSDKDGCWSSIVGRKTDEKNTGQDISIGPGCDTKHTVVHEIGHLVGLYHEQKRSDRDEHIKILWNNIESGQEHQFWKASDSNYSVPYDLTSMMHYNQWAFSREKFKNRTIVTMNPAYQRFLAYRDYLLSFRDRLLVSKLYSCAVACNETKISCYNGGYLRSTSFRNNNTSEQCVCDCPPNFTGSQCEKKLRDDYYEPLPCGGIVTTPSYIETPDFPSRTKPGQSCTWDIRAPVGYIVEIKIVGFEFAPAFFNSCRKLCLDESVEFRLNNTNIFEGDTYCGKDLARRTKLYSTGPRAVIIIIADKQMIGTGLRAKVKFVKNKLKATDRDEGVSSKMPTISAD